MGIMKGTCKFFITNTSRKFMFLEWWLVASHFIQKIKGLFNNIKPLYILQHIWKKRTGNLWFPECMFNQCNFLISNILLINITFHFNILKPSVLSYIIFIRIAHFTNKYLYTGTMQIVPRKKNTAYFMWSRKQHHHNATMKLHPSLTE